MGKISVSTKMARLPFEKFKAWHKKTLPTDPMSAEDRYISIGGVIPVKPKDPEKVTAKKSEK